MKKAIYLFSALLFGFVIFTGQNLKDESPRWTPDPAMTRMLPIGKYIPLPEPTTDNYVNPNTQIHYVYSPQGVMAVSPNYMIKTVASPSTQSEVAITSSLLNPNLVFASCNYFNGSSTFSTPGYISTNGGLNFSGMDITNSNYGDPGPMIDKNNTFLVSSIMLSSSMGAAYSTNYGASWSSVIQFPGASTSTDKNLSGTNYAASSPYYGHSYTVYTEFTGTYVNRIVFTRTTNSGVSWSTITPVSPPTSSGHHHQGCDVTAGPEGNVYAIWANCTTNGQNSTEDSLGFAKSTDDGATWVISKNNVADMNGIRAASFGPWGIRVAGFPRIDVDRSGGARNGWIYVVASEKTGFQNADASDVFLWRSTDLGATWSAGIRVNQDPVGSGKLQYHAAINVDASGGVNVVYHDCRNSNSNDSVDTYVNRSVDGGNTWTEIKVNDAKFKPAPISGTATGYQGDYIGITSANNRIFPNWCDNRIGRYQSWTCYIDIGPSITHTPLTNTEQISGTRAVNCQIIPANSGINPGLTKLNYRLLPTTTWTQVSLTNTSGQNWTGNITLSGAGTYNYYVTTTDSLSRTATAPAGAPSSYYSFVASTDITKPVITHTAIGNQPKQNWPVTVTSTVTDNIGVDSAWVRWYKNTTANYKQFKLTNTSGSTYASLFNSVSADVNPGDTIFYRIIAQDISAGHNRDSTALYKFAITNVVSNNVCRTVWVPIRDNATNYDSFQVGTHSSIIKVNFTMVQLIHTYDGDVTFAIRAPNGTEVTLSANNGASGDNYTNTIFNDSATTPIASGTAPFTGTFIPDNALSAFNGLDPYGWWRFKVSDNASGDTGHVSQYCVQIFAGGMITGTNAVGTIVPSTYNLNQNYPNPFNPVTKINFDIPKQGFVSLKIYDILGRQVRTLVNEVKAPGSYSVDFNGSELSSGVYFYRMESNGYTDIKKMLLIK